MDEDGGTLHNVVIVKSAEVPDTPPKIHDMCLTSTTSSTVTPVCRICHEGNIYTNLNFIKNIISYIDVQHYYLLTCTF